MMIISDKYGPQYDKTDGTIGTTKLVKRWRLIRGDGQPFQARQGQYSYATRKEAERLCKAFLREQPPGHHNHHMVSGLSVACWWCYPGHFDPIGPVPTPEKENSMTPQPPITIYVYSEHCTHAGYLVPQQRVDDLGPDSPDFQMFEGTEGALIATAEHLMQQSKVYHYRCGASILESLGKEVRYVVKGPRGYLVGWDDESGWPLYLDDITAAYDWPTEKKAEGQCWSGDAVERLVV